MKKFLYQNSLSLVFFVLFIISLIAQVLTGYSEYNKKREEMQEAPVALNKYVRSGHFLQATFENWESEFLQMALFVGLTVFLRQKGSSESKKIGEKETVDRKPDPRKKGAPWPVRTGGVILQFYKHSLTIVLGLFFLLSFIIHMYGSLRDENEKRLSEGKPQTSLGSYMRDSRPWFESFQNWQSEFLSVCAIVVLSVFLRQQGSSQSKPVDAPDSETGD